MRVKGLMAWLNQQFATHLQVTKERIPSRKLKLKVFSAPDQPFNLLARQALL
jgi:hypothetical protein